MYYQNNNERQINTVTDNYIAAPDRLLTLVVLFLVVIGIMFVFSASVPKCVNAGLNPLHFVSIQIVGVIIGYILMRWLTRVDLRILYNTTNFFTGIVLLLLVVVLCIGDTINGAQRWISLGPVNLQPAELAKPAVVLLLAKAFHKDARLFDPNKYMTYLTILVMVFLILKQPNLSMVILLFSTSVVMYLAAGGSISWIKKMILPILGGLGALIGLGGLGACFNFNLLGTFLQPYQLQRITIWLHPESDPLGAGYNIIQSMVAFASGGLWGSGFGASKQKLAWLPEAHTDFIFAVIGEELGFIGCLLLIGLFWTILQRGFVIASECRDMYLKLIAIGFTFSICFQAFLNMGVSSSMLPATGVPLPFISYGGTSIIISLAMVGVLLNISRKKQRKIRLAQNV
jgi:cell division protein FtsW